MRNFILTVLVIILAVQNAGATEIDTGVIKASSTGAFTENLGFKPDYIEFFSQQKTENAGSIKRAATNSNCPENVNGWSEGAVIFGASTVQKQFSIAMSRNSDSTNDHRVASSTSDVIKMPYAGRNGIQCGKLEITVASKTSSGFEYNIESTYKFDEVVRYKAYQFPDNMDFDAGLIKISSEGRRQVSTGFRPANLHFRAGQRISSKNMNRQFTDNDPDTDNTLGRTKGYATIDNGNIVQQAIGTASSSDSTNAHKSLATNDFVINTAYVGQNGKLISSSGDISRLRAKVASTSKNGFTLQIEEKWSNTDEVILYRAWGKSFYQYDVGYRVVDSDGVKTIKTKFDVDDDGNKEGFRPEAIDIYAEQQLTSINTPKTTPKNSGCDNAGGWSYGYYMNRDGTEKQFSLATGRTSDSQNSHRYLYSETYALFNQYSGQNGGLCGELKGKVTGTTSKGFKIDIQSSSEFQNNYDKELFYYRALRFPLQPPKIENIKFTDKDAGHAFKINATVREGSNDVASCTIQATEIRSSGSEGEKTYTNPTVNGNSSWSWCVLNRVSYDDDPEWKQHHDQNDELPRLKIKVTAEDVDQQSDTKSSKHRFPNHAPVIQDFTYDAYDNRHAYDTTIQIKNTDAESGPEIDTCEITFTDTDGNQINTNPEIRDANENDKILECFYSNANSTYPTGFEVKENIEASVTVRDHHKPSFRKQTTGSSTNRIPNKPPTVTLHEPANNEFVDQGEVRLNVTVVDPEGDRPLTAKFYDNSDDSLIGSNSTDPKRNYDHLSTKWLNKQIGTEQRWYVQVEDDYDSRTLPTNYWYFTKLPGAGFRVGIDLTTRYGSLIIPQGRTKVFNFKIKNQASRDKDLRLSLIGVNSRFTDETSTPKQKTTTIPATSTKQFSVEVEPKQIGEGEVMIKATNTELNLQTTENITVFTKRVSNPAEQSTETVPGITSWSITTLLLTSILFRIAANRKN